MSNLVCIFDLLDRKKTVFWSKIGLYLACKINFEACISNYKHCITEVVSEFLYKNVKFQLSSGPPPPLSINKKS